MRKVIGILAAAVATAAISGSASAAVSFTSEDFGFSHVYGAGTTVIDFDSALPSGFTLTGGRVSALDDGAGAEPAIATGVKESTKYLSVNPRDTATLLSTTGFRDVSLYWGSIDKYNTLTLLDKFGGTIASYTGFQVYPPADGNQGDASTNRRVSFTTDGATSPIYGLRFESSSPAFEVDNVAFGNAVPEPASWAMMIAGFGLVGGALRRRNGAAVTAHA